MLYDKLVRSTLGLEIIGLGVMLIPIPLVQKLPVFLFLHCVAVYSIYHWINAHVISDLLKLHRIQIIFLTFLAYLLPILGSLIMLFKTDSLAHIDLRDELSAIKTVEAPYYEMETTFHQSSFGEGGAYIQSQNPQVPVEQRIRALLALNTCIAKQKNTIMHNVLFDREDEIRLLAFGLLKVQEQQILNEIHLADKELKKTTDPIEIARLEKRLALGYWEMIFQDLAMEDLSAYAIEKALTYANSAVEHLNDDVGLWTLIGKIHLYQKQLNAAESAFKKAQHFGVAASQVVPYLAELAFYRKDYETVRQLLLSEPSLRTIPTFGSIYEFWNG